MAILAGGTGAAWWEREGVSPHTTCLRLPTLVLPSPWESDLKQGDITLTIGTLSTPLSGGREKGECILRES